MPDAKSAADLYTQLGIAGFLLLCMVFFGFLLVRYLLSTLERERTRNDEMLAKAIEVQARSVAVLDRIEKGMDDQHTAMIRLVEKIEALPRAGR